MAITVAAQARGMSRVNGEKMVDGEGTSFTAGD